MATALSPNKLLNKESENWGSDPKTPLEEQEVINTRVDNPKPCLTFPKHPGDAQRRFGL